MQLLELAKVRIDGGTQSRSETDGPKIREYANSYREQAINPRVPKFPPIVVFFDGQEHWLASGFHRLPAMLQAEFTKFEVDVRQGSLRDAILFSVGENATHGIQRTSDDMRRAVRKLLEDEEWRARSDKWCAEHARVSPDFVADLRAEMYPPTVGQPQLRLAKRGAQVYPIDTSNIGRKPTTPAPQQVLYSPPAAVLRPSGHREPHERSHLVVWDEALNSMRNAWSTLPDPLTAASQNTGFPVDDAYKMSLWMTQFAAHLRKRAERAS